MNSAHNRVSQAPARGDVAESSTSVDASSQDLPPPPPALQTTQNSAPSGQLQKPGIIAEPDVVESRSPAALIPELPESSAQVLVSIGPSPQEPQTKGEPVSDLSSTVSNPSSNPLSDRSILNPNHPMPVLGNRAIAPRPLAIAPASTPASADSHNDVATATNASVEPSLELKAPHQPRPLAPAFVPLAPKPGTLPVVEQTAIPAPPSLTTSPADHSTTLKTAVRKTPVKSGTRARKRKRVRPSEDEIRAGDSSSDDSSDDLVQVARQTKSGRQVNRPSFFAPLTEDKQLNAKTSSPSGSPNAAGTPGTVKRRKKVYRRNGKDINVTCKHCQRGHSPSSNMIVFCDECNVAWHQFCHNPPIGKELIEVEEAEWYCAECRPAQPVATIKLRLPRNDLSTPPDLSRPLVGGEKFTLEQQRGYLSSLSHAALVDMLVNLSQSNPTLPIFPENLGDLAVSKFAMSPLNRTMLQQEHELRSNDLPPMASVTETPSESIAIDSKSSKHTEKESRTEDSDDSGSEYEVEEHRLYPQPGNGFRLPPDEEDIDILLDDPDCPTFSHVIHSYAKGNVLDKGSVTISATA